MTAVFSCALLLALLLFVRPASAKKGGSKKQTVGYSYYMAALFGLCLRASNLLKVVYGERVAWEGSLSGMSGSVTFPPVNGAPTKYGFITVTVNGRYSYVLDTDNPAVKALLGNQTLEDVWAYSATHSSGQTLPGSLTIRIKLERKNVWDPDAHQGDGANVTVWSPGATPSSGVLDRPDFADPTEGVLEGGFSIDAKDLFGGEGNGGSGGLKGDFYFATGHENQLPNAIMQKYLGADCPAHRGIVTLSMDKSYVASFSPQFRILKCLVQNLGGYGWYDSKAVIARTQINPAHEIRDALINPDLSGQYAAGDLDDASFTAAANTLYAENFGLSPKWSDTGKSQDYVQSLLTHIDGVLVRDRSTGLIRLKLLRGGYDAATLPVVGPSQFSAIKTLGTVAMSAMVNKVTIKYARLTGIGEETATITQENQANIQLQGGIVNSVTLEFPHLTNAIADLPGRILSRELRARCYPLRSFTIEGKSSLSSLQEGELFVLHFPERGIDRLVCRVLEADYGTPDDTVVTLTCTEDLYGVEQIALVTPPETEWSPSTDKPTIPKVFKVIEMPWYAVLQLSGYTASQLVTDYPLSGIMMTLAAPNTAQDYGYRLKLQTQNGWEDAGDGSFCPAVPILGPSGMFDRELRVTDTSSLPLRIGDLAFLEEEIVQIAGWSTQSVTVNRGVLDTLPQDHAGGALLWLPSNTGGGFMQGLYAQGVTAKCVLATYGANGEVTPTASQQVSLKMAARFGRPYPPADLRVNGEQFPNIISGKLALTWKHRDRIEQQDSIVAQAAADIGPEAGTTYKLQLHDRNGTTLKTVSGITGNSWTWDSERLDCGTPRTQTKIKLFSMRDGLESWQAWNVTVNRIVPDNLFTACISAQTATLDGVTVQVAADGIITLNGTVTSTGAMNIKLTNVLELSAGTGRPASWDNDDIDLPVSAMTLSAEILSGSFSTPQADSLNLTLRYSAATLFLNAKIGDGLLSVSGTPTAATKMVVLYVRQGVVFNNLKLFVGIYA